MKSVKLTLLVFCMLWMLDTNASAQMELPRASNGVKHDGEWTWFTYGGVLYRKHSSRSVAEVWHNEYRPINRRDRYFGLLHDTNNVAFYYLYTSENSPLPGHIITSIRFDDKGVVWFASQTGDAASFDGLEWKLFPRSDRNREAYTWPTASPFAGDTLDHLLRRWEPVDESLVASAQLEKRRGFWCGFMEHSASYEMNVHPNGTVYLATDEGVHVFMALAEDEVKKFNNVAAAAPYPNPASTNVTFAMLTPIVQKMAVYIHDLTGRARITGVEGTTTSTQIDVTGLEEGVYVALMKSVHGSATKTFTLRR